MKRLLIVLALLLGARIAEGQVNMDITPSTATVIVGQNFTATVRVIANANHVDEAEAYLDFDQTILQVVGIANGPLMGGGGTTNFNNSIGQVNIALSTSAAFETGTFALATVTLQAIALSPGTSVSFHTASPRITAAALVGVPYAGTFTGATITVVAATATPTNTPTVPPLIVPTPTIGPTAAGSPCGPTVLCAPGFFCRPFPTLIPTPP